MNYNDEDLLSMVELYAEEVGYIYSEDNLSEIFDEMLEECYPDFDTGDSTMIVELFNNWADAMAKDGEIHPVQYNQYGYTGKYL